MTGEGLDQLAMEDMSQTNRGFNPNNSVGTTDGR